MRHPEEVPLPPPHLLPLLHTSSPHTLHPVLRGTLPFLPINCPPPQLKSQAAHRKEEGPRADSLPISRGHRWGLSWVLDPESRSGLQPFYRALLPGAHLVHQPRRLCQPCVLGGILRKCSGVPDTLPQGGAEQDGAVLRGRKARVCVGGGDNVSR